MVECSTFHAFDSMRVPSPCFVIDEVAVEHNLKTLLFVQELSGARILLALKAFSLFYLASLIRNYLAGTCASGLHEARLGYEEFGGEVHTFSVAYKKADLEKILKISDHVIFNSFNQWQRFQPLIRQAKAERPNLQFGLRINPRHSEGTTPIYDPCSPGSRLGIPRSAFDGQLLDGISGLHFHTLCEQSVEPLERTLNVVEQEFGEFLHQMQWINLGGGHHITASDYGLEQLVKRIHHLQATYGVDVYLEPGEAIAIHTGVLVSEVLDLTHNDLNLAILDTSATCHMPDTLEMPYRANIFGAGLMTEKPYGYRLGGQSCLAGDVIGDYSFDEPLQVGQRLMFDDMAHYTMVKTTTFNGVPLPAIAVWNSKTDELTIVREFGYEDFKHRLS